MDKNTQVIKVLPTGLEISQEEYEALNPIVEVVINAKGDKVLMTVKARAMQIKAGANLNEV